MESEYKIVGCPENKTVTFDAFRYATNDVKLDCSTVTCRDDGINRAYCEALAEGTCPFIKSCSH